MRFSKNDEKLLKEVGIQLWNTIIVSRNVNIDLVKELIEQSYKLTKK